MFAQINMYVVCLFFNMKLLCNNNNKTYINNILVAHSLILYTHTSCVPTHLIHTYLCILIISVPFHCILYQYQSAPILKKNVIEFIYMPIRISWNIQTVNLHFTCKILWGK